MPIVAKVLPYLNAILMVLTEIINTIASLFGYKIEDYDYFTGMADSVLDLEENLDGATESAKKLKQGLRGFDKLNVINTPTSASTGTTGGGISPDIAKAYDEAYAEYMKKLENVKMKATEIRDKIMEWLGFTKEIDKKTGKVSFKFDHITGGTVLGALAVGGGIFLGIKGLGSIISKIMTKITGKEVVNIFSAKGIQALLPKLKALAPILAKIAVAIAGIVAVINGSNGVTNSMKKMRKEMNYSGKEANTYRLRVLETVAGATALGAVIGGPLGAGIGALTGVVIAGASAWKGYDEAVTELAKSEVFGNLSISMSEWLEIFQNSTTALTDWKAKWDELNLESLYEDFLHSGEALDTYGYKFGLLKQQITEEDSVAIKNAIEDMATNSSNIIQQTTDYDFQLWSTTFKNMSTVTEEEEKNILQSILNYGKNQQTELKNAQDNITKTYDKAIKTRGYLTDEEYKYIQEQLEKIRLLTESEMSRNQANIEYYKELFKDKNVKLDEESYSEFKKALEGYTKEQKDIIENNYTELLKSAKYYYDQDAINEEEYQKQKQTALEYRISKEKELNEEIADIQATVYNDIAEKYSSLTGDLSEEAKRQKEIMENIFKDVNLDDAELRKKFKQAGVLAGKSFADGLGGKFSMNGEVVIGGGGGRVFANGGLPPVGQIFIANERGPELVGQIGGQTFVANQNQMLGLIKDEISTAKGMTNATFIIQVGDEEVARHTINKMEEMAKANGKPFTIGG